MFLLHNNSIFILKLNHFFSVDISDSVIIHSPNYPNSYPKGLECAWEFRAPDGYSVDFAVKEYRSSGMRFYYGGGNSEHTSNCPYGLSFLDGSLSFYEGSYDQVNSEDSKLVDRICIEINDTQVISTNSQNATVLFRGSPQEQLHGTSSENTKPPGFTMRAWVKCGGTLYAKQEPQRIIFRRLEDTYANIGLGKSKDSKCTYKFEKDEEAEGDVIYIRGERILYNDSIQSPIFSRLKTDFNMTCGNNTIPLGLTTQSEVNIDQELEECDDNIILSTDMTYDYNGMYLFTYGLENTCKFH